MSSERWPHQEAFLAWMRGPAGGQSRASAILDGFMGTGKTRCGVDLAQERRARVVLVLCPHSVAPAWEYQLRLHAPAGSWRCEVLNSGTVRRRVERAEAAIAAAAQSGAACWVIVNHEAARTPTFARWASRRRWDLLLLDEIHRFKSPHGVGARFVAKLRPSARCAVGLTGTLMPHSPLDVFSQCRAIDPSAFGWSWVAFRARYAVMGGFEGKEVVGYRDLDDLRARLSRVVFQVGKDVLDLPPAVHVVEPVALGGRARRIYDELERDLVARVESGEVTAANALVKLLRLQQVTGGTVPVEGDGEPERPTVVDAAKEDRLRELLEDLPADEPVVVFGRFLADLDAARRAAARCEAGARPRAVLELSGRRKELAAWQRGDAPVLAAQIQAGSVGVDMTRAARCVVYSTGFSLGDYDQALARLHRPGQRRTVTYHHLVASGTVDERVRLALERRRSVVESVLAELSKDRTTGDADLRRRA